MVVPRQITSLKGLIGKCTLTLFDRDSHNFADIDFFYVGVGLNACLL